MSTATGACKVGNLIDLSANSDLSSSEKHTATSDNVKKIHTKVDVTINEQKKSYGRLCGYLNKQGSRGILKTFRKKWFVFYPESCKLYYYRSPKDPLILGEIDVSKATFSFDVTNKEREGLFTISIPGKDYFLEANNRQTCLFWLQELQKYRRANSLLRTEQIQEKSKSVSNHVKKRPTSGLLGIGHSSEIPLDVEGLASQISIPVELPMVDIGESSNSSSNNPLSQKLSNLRNHLRNRKPDVLTVNTDTSPEKAMTSNSVFFSNISPTGKDDGNLQCPPSPSKSKGQGFSSIRSKITESFRKAIISEDEEQGSILSWRSTCAKCRGSVEKIDLLLDDITSLQDEVTTSRALIKSLQNQLDITLKQKETLMELCSKNNSVEMFEQLDAKDAHIVNLSREIAELKGEVERLHLQVVSLKAELVQLGKDNVILHETVHRKDSTIVTITNEMLDMVTEKQDEETKLKGSRSMSFLDDKQRENKPSQEYEDLEDLKIAVNAFEVQNKFLNKEVLELNQLRNDSEEREFALTMKCSEWEARCCQIQSKLLYLLNELKKPDGRSREVISRLLEEAMGDCDVDSSVILPTWSVDEMYDDLGFNWRWGKEDLLSTRAENLKQRYDDISNKAKEEIEINAWRAKWETFVVSLGDKELQRTFELKSLLRLGIPREYKGRIWRGCVEMTVKTLKSSLGPNYYNKLLTSNEFTNGIDPSSKQIELDLLRTLPNNCHYEKAESDGIPKLRRVLLAFSRHDPIVGYCQGLNRLAAIALLFMEEEDAFWCLVAVIKFLMPENYYSRTLIASLVDQRVLKDLMYDKLPRLHAHLEQHKIDLSLFTFNWFLTVFVDNVPVEMYLRIWDVFLYEGSKVLFRFALTFFKYCENEILQINDYIALSRYLRSMAENMTDIKKLSQIAFSELNPFPQKAIDIKRAQHMFIVRAQLDEFESIRNSLPRNPTKELEQDCLSEED